MCTELDRAVRVRIDSGDDLADLAERQADVHAAQRLLELVVVEALATILVDQAEQVGRLGHDVAVQRPVPAQLLRDDAEHVRDLPLRLGRGREVQRPPLQVKAGLRLRLGLRLQVRSLLLRRCLLIRSELLRLVLLLVLRLVLLLIPLVYALLLPRRPVAGCSGPGARRAPEPRTPRRGHPQQRWPVHTDEALQLREDGGTACLCRRCRSWNEGHPQQRQSLEYIETMAKEAE